LTTGGLIDGERRYKEFDPKMTKVLSLILEKKTTQQALAKS